MDFGLEGKVAVITGGSRGIGKGVGQRLAAEGCDLLLVSATEANLKKAQDEISSTTNRRVEICPADMSDPAGADAVLKATTDAYGRVDILVNSAGVAVGGGFLDITDETWQRGFGPKLFGTFRVCQRLWPLLMESHGAVINIAGGRGKSPAHDFMVNSAVNGALMNFTKALANQGLLDDVNVNCVSPGLIKTDLHYDNMRQAAKMENTTPEKVEKKRLAANGLRRFGEVEDVANLVAFLVSPVARHVQGTTAFVDGGGDKSI
jgi:3-oxoacyl-[acyl-carrier protein] reductase